MISAERAATAVKPLFDIAEWRKNQAAPFIERQDESPVREVAADPERVDRAYRLDPKPSGTTLVSERAVDEAIGKDPLPFVERGSDRPGDMVGARGREQERLGLGSPPILAAAEQQFANPLGAIASPGFASDDNVKTELAERLPYV